MSADTDASDVLLQAQGIGIQLAGGFAVLGALVVAIIRVSLRTARATDGTPVSLPEAAEAEAREMTQRGAPQRQPSRAPRWCCPAGRLMAQVDPPSNAGRSDDLITGKVDRQTLRLDQEDMPLMPMREHPSGETYCRPRTSPRRPRPLTIVTVSYTDARITRA